MIARPPAFLPALLALLAFLSPGEIRGQEIPSPYRFLDTRQEAGPFLGTLSPGTGRFGYGPSPAMAFGARYGIRLSGPFGLEGVATYMPTTRDLIDPGRDEGDRKIGEVDSHILAVDARLRFSVIGDRTWHGLNPFAFIGGGLAFDLAGEDEAEEALLQDDRFDFGNSFLGTLGTGLRWFPGDRFLVRADVSLLLWQLKSPRGFRDPEREFSGVEEKEWVSGPSFAVGLAYRF